MAAGQARPQQPQIANLPASACSYRAAGRRRVTDPRSPRPRRRTGTSTSAWAYMLAARATQALRPRTCPCHECCQRALPTARPSTRPQAPRTSTRQPRTRSAQPRPAQLSGTWTCMVPRPARVRQRPAHCHLARQGPWRQPHPQHHANVPPPSPADAAEPARAALTCVLASSVLVEPQRRLSAQRCVNAPPARCPRRHRARGRSTGACARRFYSYQAPAPAAP
jgi:hypothetical protein